ncbi:hypothetical protein SiRe_1469 [Sulfolobus islandicus REY15A]|uniref:Insertion element protein n=1 Tax=Saccharolobus islandicus (strain REY15A) TaxID=930945 RepID=F0NBJ7_SACI5|nr:hypothetical protein SiRe_1469 [Sulfolobus islandicus REY15A]
MGRKAVVRQDVSCPSCGSHHVVKCGRPLGRQRYLCRDCGRYFLGDATYHHHSKMIILGYKLFGNTNVLLHFKTFWNLIFTHPLEGARLVVRFVSLSSYFFLILKFTEPLIR